MTDLARPCRSTRLAFCSAGFAVSCWAPLVPFVRQRLGIDEAALGLLLLCLGLGSVAAMLRAGRLCARHGCRPVMVAGQLGLVPLLPLLTLAETPWALGAVLFTFGAALGTLDVATNIHAVEVERRSGRPLMSGFHAMFSVGGFIGAALVASLLSLSLGPATATLGCSALLLVAAAVTGPGVLATRQPASDAALAWPRGPVLLIAVLAAVTFLVEGALLDWSALLLARSGRVPTEQAGWGYAVFSVAMTAGRLGGDAITARLGDRAVMGWGGGLTMVGFAGALLAPTLVGSLVGFACIGLGAANIVPVLFRHAGRHPAIMPAALAVAAVSTAGYAGHLVAPALVGLASDIAGLPAVFWGLAALMALVPLCARLVAGQADAA